MKTILQMIMTILIVLMTIQLDAQSTPSSMNHPHAHAISHPWQAHQCGIPLPSSEAIKRLLKHKAASQAVGFPKNDTYYIPIQFHIIGDANGNGYIAESTVFKSICQVNEDFADSGLQFYFSGAFNYLNDDILYNPDDSQATAAYVVPIILANKNPNALNVFIMNTIYGPTGPSGGYFPNIPPIFPELDYIAIRKDYVFHSSSFLTHEIGHYFGLMHTFFGWESYVYDSSEPTPTYHIQENSILNTSDTLYVEYVDRSINCETAGDFFCDTPPDYFWDVPTNTCEYTGDAVDPDGQAIDPDERNFMSYFDRGECELKVFSEDQKGAMMANYLDRPELNQLDPPDLSAITDATQLVAPINEAIVSNLEEVNLVWEEVPHASIYLLQISRFNNFSTSGLFEEFYTSTPSITIADLVDDQTYHWRVWAFNSSTYCEESLFSETGVFMTDASAMTSTFDMDDIKTEIKISPNPLSLQQDALKIWVGESLQDVAIQVYSINGQLIQNLSAQTLDKGWNELNGLNQNKLQVGLYFLQLKSSEISITQKMVIQ